MRALAMVAEVLHGAPYRFSGPARFSLAHGRKDRHPFPVPIRVYDQTIQALKSAVRKAKPGRDEEEGALKRLDDQAHRLENHVSGPSVRRSSRKSGETRMRMAAGAFSDGNKSRKKPWRPRISRTKPRPGALLEGSTHWSACFWR